MCVPAIMKVFAPTLRNVREALQEGRCLGVYQCNHDFVYFSYRRCTDLLLGRYSLMYIENDR